MVALALKLGTTTLSVNSSDYLHVTDTASGTSVTMAPTSVAATSPVAGTLRAVREYSSSASTWQWRVNFIGDGELIMSRGSGDLPYINLALEIATDAAKDAETTGLCVSKCTNDAGECINNACERVTPSTSLFSPADSAALSKLCNVDEHVRQRGQRNERMRPFLKRFQRG